MLLSPKDFAKAIGKSYALVRKHLSRKKIIKSGDFIDTEYEINHHYIMDQTNGKGLDLSKINEPDNEPVKDKTNQSPKPPNPVVVEKPIPPQPKEPRTSKEPSKEEVIRWNLDLRKKQADAERAERDNELKAIEIQKKRGELMPVELVRSLFVVNLQSVFRAFEMEADRVASIYCDVLGGDRTQLAEMAKLMRESLQKCIEDVKQQADEDSKAAIKEYSQVRSRGERK